MRDASHNIVRRLAAAAALATAVAAGCRSDCGPDKCADIPQGAIPQPNGVFACQWQTTQTARAREDFFMIYENEWYLGGKELGPFGQQHIAQIADHLKNGTFKVAIEPQFDAQRNAPDDELNKARVDAVAKALALAGVESAFDRVELAPPHAEGLYGDEAVRIGSQRLPGPERNGAGGSPFGGPFGGTGSATPTGGVGGAGGIGVGGGIY